MLRKKVLIFVIAALFFSVTVMPAIAAQGNNTTPHFMDSELIKAKAKELGIETEGKDNETLAKEVRHAWLKNGLKNWTSKQKAKTRKHYLKKFGKRKS